MNDSAVATEVVSIEIHVDGRPALGMSTTNTGQSPREIWNLLRTQRLSIERNFHIPVATPDANTARIQGEIQVLLIYGNARVKRSARLRTLTITRGEGHNDDWLLSPVDVERTWEVARTHTVHNHPNLLNSDRTIRRLGSAFLFLAGAVAIAWLMRMRVAQLTNSDLAAKDEE